MNVDVIVKLNIAEIDGIDVLAEDKILIVSSDPSHSKRIILKSADVGFKIGVFTEELLEAIKRTKDNRWE